MNRTKRHGCELKKTVKIKASMSTQWALLKKKSSFLWFVKFLNCGDSRKGTGKGTSFYSEQRLLISTGVFFSTGPTLFPLWGITSIKITGLGDQLLPRVLSLPSSVARTHKHVPTSGWVIVEGYRLLPVTRNRRENANEGHNSFQAMSRFFTRLLRYVT